MRRSECNFPREYRVGGGLKEETIETLASLQDLPHDIWMRIGEKSPQFQEKIKNLRLHEDIERLWDFRESFLDEENINIEDYAREFQSDSDEERTDYSIYKFINGGLVRPGLVRRIPDEEKTLGEGERRYLAGNTGLDTEYGMGLIGDEPLALCGFDVDMKERIMEIRQLQGVKDKQEELRPIQWERMLVKIATDCAEEHGFREARIQPAKHNKYLGKISKDRLKMRYDVTAKRMGFEISDDEKYFFKKLNG
ncbi:MAG: hypothetical protein ABEK36_01485 [Candidatus Aenigmatarchaeota archaeon]